MFIVCITGAKTKKKLLPHAKIISRRTSTKLVTVVANSREGPRMIK